MKKRFFATSALFVMMVLVATLSFAADKKGAGEMAKPAAAKASAAKEQLLDINTATEAELKAVPGIGDTYAKKIVAERPYKGKNDLKKKNIVPADVYDQIKDKVIAKRPKN